MQGWCKFRKWQKKTTFSSVGLDLLVTVLTALLVFASCIFLGGLSVRISLLIAAVVFLVGIRFGRSIAEVLRFFLLGPDYRAGYYTELFRFPEAESWRIGLTSSDAQPISLRLNYLQWVLGLTVPSIPRSRLANLDGGFEYGAEREYSSQFMCSK